MTAGTITFINEPEFKVDFARYSETPVVDEAALQHERGDIIAKTAHVAYSALRGSGLLLWAVGKSTLKTLGSSHRSFLLTVLGHHGSLVGFRPPADIHLLIFRLAFWVLGLGASVATGTYRELTSGGTTSAEDQVYLAAFADPSLNLEHIRTKYESLDSSGVPATITMDTLLELFDAINFDDPDAPGYMDPTTSLKEGSTVLSKANARRQLAKFVDYTKRRQAFLGTPPSYETDQLLAFYQVIEDANRLSMQAVIDRRNAVDSDLETREQQIEARRNNELETAHDDAKPAINERYNEERQRLRALHNDVLENCARLAIDAAIAGGHCGARFMGDSLVSHGLYCKDVEADSGLTLEDRLCEVLADERKAIADAQIQAHLGTDTHGYANYMQHLGSLLAIPGAQNVIEHLSSSRFDRERHLRRFFSTYTVNHIIDTVQKAVKESDELRKQIIDWLQAEAEGWNSCTEKIEQDVAKIEEILSADADVSGLEDLDNLKLLQNLIKALNDEDVELPTLEQGGWNDFIHELFFLDEAKAWFATAVDDRFAARTGREKNMPKNMWVMLHRNKVTASLKKDAVAGTLEAQYLANNQVDADAFATEMAREVKVQEIRKIISLDDAVLGRIVDGDTDAKDALEGYYQRSRNSDFLAELRLETMTKEGISPELVEWLLVHHNILKPQELGLGTKDDDDVEVLPNESDLDTYLNNMIGAHDPVKQVQIGLAIRNKADEDVVIQELKESDASASSKRYDFKVGDPRQYCLRLLFDKAYKDNPTDVVAASERITGTPFYSRRKQRIWERIPTAVSATLDNPLVKITASIALTYFLAKQGMNAYKDVKLYTAAKVVPYVINNAPIQVIRVGNAAANALTWVMNHKFRAIGYAFMAQTVLSFVPITAVRNLANRINIFSILFMQQQSLYMFLFEKLWDSLSWGWNGCEAVSNVLAGIAERARRERVETCRAKSYNVWRRACLTLESKVPV